MDPVTTVIGYIAAFGPILIAIIAGITAYAAKKNADIAQKNLELIKKQMEIQSKLNSAQITLETIKRMREKDFKDLIDEIFDKKYNVPYNQPTMERFLNHLDMMARFHEEGSISMDHIKQVYGGLLKKICKDKQLKEFIEKDEELYSPLKRLLAMF